MNSSWKRTFESILFIFPLFGPYLFDDVLLPKQFPFIAKCQTNKSSASRAERNESGIEKIPFSQNGSFSSLKSLSGKYARNEGEGEGDSLLIIHVQGMCKSCLASWVREAGRQQGTRLLSRGLRHIKIDLYIYESNKLCNFIDLFVWVPRAAMISMILV